MFRCSSLDQVRSDFLAILLEDFFFSNFELSYLTKNSSKYLQSFKYYLLNSKYFI